MLGTINNESTENIPTALEGTEAKATGNGLLNELIV